MTAHAAGANSFSDGAPEVGPKDWSTAYSQYLVRSAAQSAKTLKLYQEVLEHVSQGKLAPTVFQEHFPRFAQARGVEYARKLSELGAQFLSGLVRVGTFNAAPPERAGAGGFESDIQPPHFEPSDPARWIQQLAEYVGALNARALKAYRRQLDRVAAGEATPGEVQQTTSDYLANHLPLYLQRAGQLYLDLLNGVNEIRAGYEEDYFLTMLAAAPAAGGESAIEPPVVLNLSGPLRSGLRFADRCQHHARADRDPLHGDRGTSRRRSGSGIRTADRGHSRGTRTRPRPGSDSAAVAPPWQRLRCRRAPRL